MVVVYKPAVMLLGLVEELTLQEAAAERLAGRTWLVLELLVGPHSSARHFLPTAVDTA
jgi:hypothetical protein